MPLYIYLKSGKPFGFAGLYEYWTSPEGTSIGTCAIITTRPNALMAPIHDRMPAIVRPEHHAVWLDPTVEDDHQLQDVLEPFPVEDMEAYEVSRLVNSPRNNTPACLEAVERG